MKSDNTKLSVIVTAALLLAIAHSLAFAQSERARTTQDTKISVHELDFRLMPMTRDELQIEADGWLEILQDQLEKISRLRIQIIKAGDKSKPALLEKLNSERERQTLLTDRLNAVIEELRRKGGDVETFEQYVSALSGRKFDMTDTEMFWAEVVGWLKSDEGSLRWAKNVLLFLLTLMVFKIVARILGRITQHSVDRFKGASDLLKHFLVNLVRNTTFVIGVVIALSMLEVNIGPFLATIGAAGFIIGFALQGVLSNFASGIMILLYRPYDVGDDVKVAGITGKVEAMTLVSTTLKLPDNQLVTIPNSSIWGDTITNITGSETRRVDLVFGIGYDDDIAKADSILTEILSSHPLVLDEPEAVVRVHELADSSVNFVVRPWVRTSDYFTVYWDVTRAVKERFDAHGISIPYPQLDIHYLPAQGDDTGAAANEWRPVRE